MVRMILAAVIGPALVGVAIAEEVNITAKEDALIVRKVHTEVVPAPERNPRRTWEANGYATITIPMPKGWSEIGGAEVYGPIYWFKSGECE